MKSKNSSIVKNSQTWPSSTAGSVQGLSEGNNAAVAIKFCGKFLFYFYTRIESLFF